VDDAAAGRHVAHRPFRRYEDTGDAPLEYPLIVLEADIVDGVRLA